MIARSGLQKCLSGHLWLYWNAFSGFTLAKAYGSDERKQIKKHLLNTIL